MKTIDCLPPEILHLILQPDNFIIPRIISLPNVEYNGYINLRLVSQTFCAIITPHIFRHLRIKSTECSLKRLEAVAESEHLKKLVKTYTYVLSKSRAPTRTAYDEYLRLAADPSGLLNPDIIRASKNPNLLQLPPWIKQYEFELSNDLHELHVKNLATLPNLISISIEAPRWCSLSDMPHDMDISIGGRQWGPVVFRAILQAMYNRTQTPNVIPLEGLAIEGVSEECMLLPPSFVSKAITGMQDIKHLKFSIRTLHDTLESTTPGWILLIGRLIQSVASLESLEIEVQESVTEIHFRSLITPCISKIAVKSETPFPPVRWPNLKRLILNDLIFTESHLLYFIIAHRRSLKYISFNSCRLRFDPPSNEPDAIEPNASIRTNPWSNIFRAIHTHFAPKSSSALTHFHVEELWYDQPKPGRMHDCETQKWTAYIAGILDTEPPSGPTRDMNCTDCLDEEDSDDGSGSTDDSDDAIFYGGTGFDFGLWDDDNDQTDEDDMDSDEDDLDDDDDDMDPVSMGMAGHPHVFFGGFGV